MKNGAFLLFCVAGLLSAELQPAVRLQGRVSASGPGGTNLVFKAESGAMYTLQRTPAAEALFLDTNLWPRLLLLTGKASNHTFEVTGNLRSVKDGKVHELFYYCDICSISTSIPGLCQCCREPSVLTEEPAPGR